MRLDRPDGFRHTPNALSRLRSAERAFVFLRRLFSEVFPAGGDLGAELDFALPARCVFLRPILPMFVNTANVRLGEMLENHTRKKSLASLKERLGTTRHANRSMLRVCGEPCRARRARRALHGAFARYISGNTGASADSTNSESSAVLQEAPATRSRETDGFPFAYAGSRVNFRARQAARLPSAATALSHIRHRLSIFEEVYTVFSGAFPRMSQFCHKVVIFGHYHSEASYSEQYLPWIRFF